MNDIGKEVLNIFEKLEAQVKKSKEVMETYKKENINEVSAQTRLNWMTDVMKEYTSLKNILTELPESLSRWAKERIEKFSQ